NRSFFIQTKKQDSISVASAKPEEACPFPRRKANPSPAALHAHKHLEIESYRILPKSCRFTFAPFDIENSLNFWAIYLPLVNP
ncbi:hypothetical protein, partial [Thalassobacillus sp. CUG 92003]|uniref:hypothetical protein n=1 Tax=Thalassobacillus sp. CUG 92003 TaxID=2736641 RepID=UPI001C62AF9B